CGPVAFTPADDGDPVSLPTKCLGLLAYLALEPGPHSRDIVSALLWGDSPGDRASGSLRQALTRLRAAVGDDLRVERMTVALTPGFPSDVATFHRLADAGDERALDVDVPRFLRGLPLRDSARFEEWAERTRDALVHRWRALLVNVARSASARHEWQRAHTLGDRWQSLDPLSDEAAHFRVEVRYLMGDRDGALAAWRDFRAMRRRETGNEPGLALRELAARIETAPLAPARPTRPQVFGAQELPAFDADLVGRDAEWRALLGAWSEVAAGDARVVLLDGEPGMGRTRLVDDFLRLAATRGATVLRGRAFESGLDVPYGPMLEVLRAATDAPGVAGTDGTWLAEVARVVPAIRQRFPSLPQPAADPSTGRSLLHEGVAQLLLAVADESPLVIAIDDVHWVDGDSCRLLHGLVRRLEGAPILWFVTLALGSVGRDAPAAQLVRSLGARPHAQRLHLAPLSRDEVWTLIRSLGRVRHPQGGARLATRVHELAGGNVLYVMELLKTLFARGWLALDPSTGEWMTTEIGGDVLNTGEMFPTVREGVAERVAALPDEEHALLLTVAAAGRGCHTSLLSYVHGISRLRAAHTCDALVERHLVTEDDATYRCTHALIASVVLDSVGPSRRREVHRMIALALTDAAASMGREVDPGAVARHAEAGGESAMAHRHALLASAQCAAQGAWDDALAWLDLSASCAETPAEANAAHEASAALLDRAGWPSVAARDSGRRFTSPSIGRGDVDLIGRSGLIASDRSRPTLPIGDLGTDATSVR
ncbi:MAG: AAA family ATPase, partial [Gemmatimonadaceae bacterium]